MKNQQLALDVSLREDVGFDTFVTGHNSELVNNLQRAAQGDTNFSLLFIWGEAGGGKTHLLNACYRLASESGRKPWYLALRDLAGEPDAERVLESLDDFDFYCIDGLGQIAGQRNWEEKLFELCNRVRDQEKSIILSATRPPIDSGITLRDLVTRLMSGLTYQVLPLGEEQKIAALRERAGQRGFELSEDAVKYILNRYQRQTGHLFNILDRLDRASLEHKRVITIPFLRGLDLE